MSQALVDGLRAEALELGFLGLRVASAEPFIQERSAAIGRARAGLFAGMAWLDEARIRVATDPGALVPGARSLVSVAMTYGRPGHAWQEGSHGKIARYAWTRDYHVVLKERLGELKAWLLARAPGQHCAVVVDTGRVMDRALAVRSGLGWYGKNAMVLTPRAGSWVLLGEMLTTVDLPADPPLEKRCGRCTRCLDVCPTGALVAPGVVDARRCISYLTIEHRGPIPRALRPAIGRWIFGCDLCQEVCPVNDAVDIAAASALEPVLDPEPRLASLLSLQRAEFRQRYGHTAVARAGWVPFLRNVCVAMGNARDPDDVAPLSGALAHDEPLVRSHAAWALGQIGGAEARAALLERLRVEDDAAVRDEIRDALNLP